MGVRKRVGDDLNSISDFEIDANLPLRRYLQVLPDDSNLLEVLENNAMVSWDTPLVYLLLAVQRRH